MTQGRGPDGRKVARAPFPRRSRRRWVVAGGVAASWLVLYVVTRGVFSATVLLVLFAAAGTVAVLFLRSMGVTRNHPWVRRLSSRPWRDGQAVLRTAVSHLPDVFVITPSGALFAPNVVEVQMNREDLVSLSDRIELSVVTASVTEHYEDVVSRYGAQFATPERAQVYVVGDDGIPRGRYRLQHGHPAAAAAAREFAYAVPQRGEADSGEWGWREPDTAITEFDGRTMVDIGMATVLEKTFAAVPVLRLVTGRVVAQTRMTGARAGRGSVELVLPNVPTISREHARFAFSEGHWCVTNLGRNGLTVNGTPVVTEHQLSDGDTIRWGSRPDAPVSRVEIG
ncbi:MAG TPA: FHA domain-containing protein [Trebonia sp.]|jgi:hypothetical protein|nr:FHA domain-containing protein [Trebonia sp.]